MMSEGGCNALFSEARHSRVRSADGIKTVLKHVTKGSPMNYSRRRPSAASRSPFFVASGVSRIIILRRACEKPHKIREFEPTHVGCYVMVASGVSRIILFCRAFDKLRTIREFGPTHVGCYVMIDELDAALAILPGD
jgi:hypothetical protein